MSIFFFRKSSGIQKKWQIWELKKCNRGEADIPGWVTWLATGLDGVGVALDVWPADLFWQCQEERNEIWLISIKQPSQKKCKVVKEVFQKWMGEFLNFWKLQAFELSFTVKSILLLSNSDPSKLVSRKDCFCKHATKEKCSVIRHSRNKWLLFKSLQEWLMCRLRCWKTSRGEWLMPKEWMKS